MIYGWREFNPENEIESFGKQPATIVLAWVHLQEVILVNNPL